MNDGPLIIGQDVPKENITFQEIDITKFIPLANRVIGRLIKDPNQEITTKAGIVLPSDKQEPYVEAVVVAVGRGLTIATGIIPPETQIGDICLLFNGKYYELKDGDKKFIIFQESDIVARYKSNQTKPKPKWYEIFKFLF